MTTTIDAVDGQTGNAKCAAAGGACTLRAAVQEANALPGTDTIHLRAARYRLTIVGALDNVGDKGDLDVAGGLKIVGVGAKRTIIDANASVTQDRALHLLTGAEARISRLTVMGGHGTQGGGIFVDHATAILKRVYISRNTADDQGGGVYNLGGRLDARDSSFVANEARDDGGAIATNSPNPAPANANLLRRVSVRRNTANMDAGGVEIEEGHLTLLDSSVTGNTATHQDGGGIEIDNATMTAKRTAIYSNTTGDNGGGIENDGGTVTLENITISGNTATMFGGGIDQTVGASTLFLRSSTLNGNLAAGGGGGVSNRTGNALHASNSIVNANGPQDCGGEPNATTLVTSAGFNLASDSSCNFTQASDLPSTNPHMGPLALNGGRSRTHALLPGSPAIGSGSGGPATDQRGVARRKAAAPIRAPSSSSTASAAGPRSSGRAPCPEAPATTSSSAAPVPTESTPAAAATGSARASRTMGSAAAPAMIASTEARETTACSVRPARTASLVAPATTACSAAPGRTSSAAGPGRTSARLTLARSPPAARSPERQPPARRASASCRTAQGGARTCAKRTLSVHDK